MATIPFTGQPSDEERSEAAAMRQRVRRLALPAVGEQLLNTLVGLTDVYLVGNLSLATAAILGYSSAIALAAVGLSNQMMWLITVLLIALGIGATALIGRAIGARQPEDVARITRQAMLIAAIAGVISSAAAFFLAEPFLRLVGAEAAVIPLGVSYMQILAPAFFTGSLLFVANALWRGAGDSRTPFYLMLGVNLANIVISWLLVDGAFGLPALGIAGVAIGTALSRGAGGLVALGLLVRGHSGLKLGLDLRPDWEIVRRIVRISLPTAGEQLIFQGAILIFVRFVTDIGTVAYAAHNLAITIESLSFLPGMGYAAATTALVSQALGARNPKLAADYAYESLRQGGLMMSLIGLTMVLFPTAWLSVFTNDPAVIAAAEAPLRAAGLVQPALAVSFILLGSLRGAGDVGWPVYSRLITTWAVRLPLLVVFVDWLGLGLGGVWLAMCTDFTLQALLAIWRFGRGKWSTIKL